MSLYSGLPVFYHMPAGHARMHLDVKTVHFKIAQRKRPSMSATVSE